MNPEEIAVKEPTSDMPDPEAIRFSNPPYRFRGLLLLQFMGLLVLGILIYFTHFLLETDSSYIDYQDFVLVSRETYSIVGFGLGFLLVGYTRLSFTAKQNIKISLLLILMIILILLLLPYLEPVLPFDLPTVIHDFNDTIINTSTEIALYTGAFIIFTLAPVAGVYGLMLGHKRGITTSLLSFFVSLFTIGNLDYFKDDMVDVFLDTTKYTLFSIFFLLYVELGYGICHLTRRYHQLKEYDAQSQNSYATEDSFQFRYGMEIAHYDSNYASGQMSGILVVFFPVLVLVLTLAFTITLLSVNLDFLFTILMGTAYQESIIAGTIFGKVLFAVAFFSLLIIGRSLVPTLTRGSKALERKKAKS